MVCGLGKAFSHCFLMTRLALVGHGRNQGTLGVWCLPPEKMLGARPLEHWKMPFSTQIMACFDH